MICNQNSVLTPNMSEGDNRLIDQKHVLTLFLRDVQKNIRRKYKNMFFETDKYYCDNGKK
jgi:hypothetical protein